MVRASGKQMQLHTYVTYTIKHNSMLKNMANASLYLCVFSGILKLAVLIFAFFLVIFLAFQLLEINMDFKLGSLMRE